MPIMKGIPATIEPSDQQVLTLMEIVGKLKGGA
jgi:formylmethanofuran dehydrogenase subunit D